MNTIILLIFFFIFGTLIGSFLNVVILRYNTGLNLNGRSKCFSCNKTLSWFELIPILSYIFQNGRCRSCYGRISYQYPIVELSTALLFSITAYYFPPISAQDSFLTFYYLLIASILIVIFTYDIKHKIIPDSLSYGLSALAFTKLFISSELNFILPSIIDILSGPIIALPFFLLWLFSHGKWMGLGDAKLALGIGWILGLIPAINAIILSFWIGAIISVLWMFIVFRKFRGGYEIPFGPYMIIGMYIVLFFNIYAIDFINLFYE